MHPECIQNQFKIQIGLAHRFRQPFGSHFNSKNLSKNDPETMPRHSQGKCCYQQSGLEKLRPGSALKPIKARHQKVSFLLLFTVVLKASSLATKGEYIYLEPTKPQ